VGISNELTTTAEAGDGSNVGHVAVVGGGISGLAAAHFLAAAGARVTLFEASDQLGGLGTFFPYRDGYLERFYHCMLPSDRHLLGLLQDIGLNDQTYWKDTSFGFMRGGRLYDLNTPADLLRFDVLPMHDRLRVGLTGLWGAVRPADGLDDVTCVEWLTRLSGRRAFETFWRPMLEAKFGDRYEQVPALWFWTRFNREKGGKRERKGYIRGGYRRIAHQLAAAIEANGGSIKLGAAVEHLDLGQDGRPLLWVPGEGSRTFDRLVLTAPVPILRRLVAGGHLAHEIVRVDDGLDIQGVVNAVFMLRRGLTRHYWVAAIDQGIPFQGIVESTTLLDRADTAGVHLVYLMNYQHRSDPRFAWDDGRVLDLYGRGLQRLFPDLGQGDIIDRYVFRSPFVEPLYTLGYSRRKPPMALVAGRVYLATTTQVYPDVTSWNGATGLARRMVDALLEDARHAAAPRHLP
jgi:protoporphyrinogen oxidase